MKYKPTLNPLAVTINKELLDDLCIYIKSNINSRIGWAELIARSELNHKDLQYCFEKYMQTTPMTYIRKLREDNKKATRILTKRELLQFLLIGTSDLAFTTN